MTFILVMGIELLGILLISFAGLLLVWSGRVLLLPRNFFRILVAVMGLYASLSFFAFGLFVLMLPALQGAN